MKKTYYCYDYSATKGKWILRRKQDIRRSARALENRWAETAVEAKRLAYLHCEKMQDAVMSQVKSWEKLIQDLQDDNQWRQYTPCRPAGGAMNEKFCATHNYKRCPDLITPETK
jgi:hypothetical protein